MRFHTDCSNRNLIAVIVAVVQDDTQNSFVSDQYSTRSIIYEQGA